LERLANRLGFGLLPIYLMVTDGRFFLWPPPPKQHKQDEDDNEDEEEDDNDDEEEQEEEEEDDDDDESLLLFPRKSPPGPGAGSGSGSGRHVKAWRKQPLLARLIPRRLLVHFNATAASAGNATAPARLLQATRALPARRLAGLGLRLLLVAALAYGLSQALSFKATMQALMIVSVLAEIAGRLGLLKDLRLPLPFLPAGSGGAAAAALRAQARGPATFSFELLNDRYQADMARLGLLTGNGGRGRSPVFIATDASRAAAAAAAAARQPPPRALDFVRTPAYGTAAPVANATTAGPAAANATAAAAAAAASNSTAAGAPASVAVGRDGPKPRCYVMAIKGDLYLSQGPYLAQAVSFLLGAWPCRDIAKHTRRTRTRGGACFLHCPFFGLSVLVQTQILTDVGGHATTTTTTTTHEPTTEAARPGVDEVLVLLESGGGAAYEYGLGASQVRITPRSTTPFSSSPACLCPVCSFVPYQQPTYLHPPTQRSWNASARPTSA
jgi:hypothetical protein